MLLSNLLATEGEDSVQEGARLVLGGMFAQDLHNICATSHIDILCH